MAKFDIKSDLKVATKPLYAGVGVTDLAVERVRGYVTEAQKRTQKRLAEASQNVRKVELEPKALRDQAVTRVNDGVDALEKRVSAVQADALATVGGAYDGLVNRGESLVTRIRRQPSTQATTSSARTTTTKAKTTRTQAAKATKSTATTAKKSAGTAKKSAGTTKRAAATKSAPARSSVKATTTAAKQTATDAAQATTDAAAKVGD